MKIKAQELYWFSDHYRRLQKVARSLHHLDEAACNYELTPRQETRAVNLFKEAEAIADRMGLKVYHQSDPRGLSLYLVDSLKDADSTYSSSGCPVY